MTSFIVSKVQIKELADHPKLISYMSDLTFKFKQIKISIDLYTLLSIYKSTMINQRSVENSQSTVKLIRVEPDFGEAELKNLADVCFRSEKAVFLNLPHADELPQSNNPITWNIKRALDWLAAFAILLILSPVMISLAAIIASSSSGSIFFHQWRIGESGKLFRIIKFRTMITDADKLHHLVMSGQTGLHKCEDDPRITNVGRWMRKYSLDELPQLFNVLRGEMSLVGPRPWALYDALRINGDRKRRLNSLPGVTGAWQVSARSTMLDLDAVTDCDLNYLRNWSLWSDLKILLMTVPKVLSGFGAY
ncbi:sugar transferase [Pseudanabaena sp. UWO311]|uniref:heterocyst development glycosyltransferase HepC n=1 Tax=Pseudanabaena sp. UWO311 TaxID=2487337 RepID=UPI00115866CD|nr:heterocyst development glycosyltransferase HepC [Pseudanabaena sp. UWO311]TYQ25673.1 sugar transferase [Pseudanabaena sp. UWO311]